MSRSYRKRPYFDYVAPDTQMKTLFNRSLRRKPIEDEVDTRPSNYKRRNESWDIHDARCFCSWEDYWNCGNPMCSRILDAEPICDRDSKVINEAKCRKCFNKYVKRK